MTPGRSLFSRLGRPRYRVGVALLSVCVVGAVLATTFKPAAAGISGAAARSKPTPAIELVEADLATVRSRAVDRTVFVSGVLQPLLLSALTAEVDGRVASVDVRAGDKVVAGQVLARLDGRDLQSRLAEQRARYASSHAQYLLAQKNQERNEELLARKFISRASLDSSQSALDANRETMNAQRAQVVLAQQAADKAVIRAPINGVIADRAIEPGQSVVPGAKLLTVVDLGILELAANVPVSEVGSVRVGQTLQLQVAGMDAPVVGTVQRIAPMTDPATRMIPVYVHVANPSHVLKGGMLVQGAIVVGRGKPGYAIPAAAIRGDGERCYVLRVRNNHVERVSIHLDSDRADDEVAVSGGVSDGDRIVLARIRKIVPGQRVSIPMPQETKAGPLDAKPNA